MAAALLVRHYRYEQKLASVLWRIEAKDLTFISAYNAQSTDKVVCEVSFGVILFTVIVFFFRFTFRGAYDYVNCVFNGSCILWLPLPGTRF